MCREDPATPKIDSAEVGSILFDGILPREALVLKPREVDDSQT